MHIQIQKAKDVVSNKLIQFKLKRSPIFQRGGHTLQFRIFKVRAFILLCPSELTKEGQEHRMTLS